ncbi:MAG: endopeptidase La [Bacteroides sp.]
MSKEKTRPEEEKSLPEIQEDEAIQPPIGQYELSDFVAAMRETRPEVLPLIELRNNVLFPRTLTPITVGRARTKKLVDDLSEGQNYVIVVAQRDPSDSHPYPKDLYEIGTLARVVRPLTLQNSFTLFVEGLCRVKITEFLQVDPYYRVRYDEIPEEDLNNYTPELLAVQDLLKDAAFEYSEQLRGRRNDVEGFFDRLKHYGPEATINFISMYVPLEVEHKIELLETPSLLKRVYKLLEFIQLALQTQKIKQEIQERTRESLDEQQREFILQQQLKTIQEELGGESNSAEDVERLRNAGKKKKWGKEVEEVFQRELTKLSRLNVMSPDYSLQLTYLQFFVALPWGELTKDNYDLVRAQKILDKDHFGLEQVKERILEYLAVLKLKKDLKSPIICLYGPPGVGKTSLGQSVAQALGRKYGRISLGGMHDESEIRGHRRTYVGALPGRVLSTLRKVGSSNPVIILDEVDKLRASNVGDPAAALLEVLDPEQNSTFHDNYLDVDYDLSHVLFITTANDISTIPAPLRDRMEMIEVSGYLVEEKVAIAQKHLIPKLLKDHGVKATQFKLSEELTQVVVDDYTRESGVRKLSQQIAKLVRQQAKFIAMKEDFNASLSLDDVRERLGKPRYYREDAEHLNEVGVAVGMAWTQVGGEVLYVESSLTPGNGKLTMTGSLGDVMKESATIAFQVVKGLGEELGIPAEAFDKKDVHIHVPEGAIPKDGPSAGVTMVTSLVSSYLKKAPVGGIAMTGEVTLRGKVLPVGGIKEKILAAKRAGLSHILLSKENLRDIDDIKEGYREGMKFTYVENIRELLSSVFEGVCLK